MTKARFLYSVSRDELYYITTTTTYTIHLRKWFRLFLLVHENPSRRLLYLTFESNEKKLIHSWFFFSFSFCEIASITSFFFPLFFFFFFFFHSILYAFQWHAHYVFFNYFLDTCDNLTFNFAQRNYKKKKVVIASLPRTENGSQIKWREAIRKLILRKFRHFLLKKEDIFF